MLLKRGKGCLSPINSFKGVKLDMVKGMRSVFVLIIFWGTVSLIAESTVKQRVKLEFREVTFAGDKDGEKVIFVDGNEKTVWLKKAVLLNEGNVKSAKLIKDIGGGNQILINFTENGSVKFAKITKDLVGKYLAIVINGKCISKPMVNEQIKGGKAQVSGEFTEKEAQSIVDGLNGQK